MRMFDKEFFKVYFIIFLLLVRMLEYYEYVLRDFLENSYCFDIKILDNFWERYVFILLY